METGSGVEPRITKSCFPARVKKHGCQAYTVDREPQKQISKIVSDLELSNV